MKCLRKKILNFFKAEQKFFTEVNNRDILDWYKILLWLLRRKCHNLRLFMACFACENPSPFYLSERSLHRGRWSERSDDHQRRLCSLPQASTKIMTIFSTSFKAGISSNIKSIRLGFGLEEELILPTSFQNSKYQFLKVL